MLTHLSTCAIAHTQKDLNLEIEVHTWGSAAKERNRQEFQEREEKRNMQMTNWLLIASGWPVKPLVSTVRSM